MQVTVNTKEDAVRAALSEYARRSGGALARAAQDNYNVKSGVLDDVASRLKALIERRGYHTWLHIFVEGSAESARLELEDRDSPRQYAFAALAEAKEAIFDLENAADGLPAIPEGLTVETGRIARASYRLDGNTTRLTVVPVHVESMLGGERIVLVRAEEP